VPGSDRTTDTGEVVVRVGVTGHRAFADEAGVADALRLALAKLGRDASRGRRGAPVKWTIVSALAEGADRLVARALLARPGTKLEVSLPLPVDGYQDDFPTDPSKAEFRRLLALDPHPRHAPDLATREEAYEWAGRDVVDRCDVLVALWDGRPSRGRGGTAEIVEYARQKCVPVWWIDPSAAPPVLKERPHVSRQARATTSADGTTSPSDGLTEEARWDLEAFRAPVDDAAVDQAKKEWLPPDEDAYPSLSLAELAKWVTPRFVRADALAIRYQKWYQRASALIFAFAVLAVAAVAVQDVFFHRHPWIAVFELAWLGALAALFAVSRRLRWHDRWISYRYLAERLRSAFFLAVAGVPPDDVSSTAVVEYSRDPDERWIERALTDVMNDRPELAGDPNVPELRHYLASHWIGGQAKYHCRASSKQRRVAQRTKWLAIGLFFLAVAVAVLHLSPAPDHMGWSRAGDMVVLLAIVVPAIGAAIHGIESQREYERHAERYQRMAELLRQLREQMDQAPDLASIHDICVATERAMREENGDWFGVMRFHDVNLIS
jgi:hypothetical protein